MRVRILALLFVVAIGYGAVRYAVHSHGPDTPQILARDDDAHRELSTDLDARFARFFEHSPPGVRPKLIALTFDDGPYPVETPLLLATLHELGVPATFFLIGRDAAEFPELTERIAASGNEIANHTETHPDLDKMDTAGVKDELSRGAAELGSLVRDPAVRELMRPPHGRFTIATIQAAQSSGYQVILWSEDPGDWRTMTPAQIANHVELHPSAPEIVLLHSGRLPTVEALPGIVERFQRAGYKFVTVGEMERLVPMDQINHPTYYRSLEGA